ncbi:hypothetical protein WG66_015909 [Moniliophthora roreri]|nr:hypothetical protein WG66_015909 [Moniliophthora roreri]
MLMVLDRVGQQEHTTPTATMTASTRSTATPHTRLKSLIISPNLDALLEHEERVRSARIGWSPGSPWSEGSGSPHSSMSLDSGMPQLKPLSPPPRRRPRTSQESRHSSSRSVSPHFSSEIVNQPNPYINPAPTIQELTWVQDELLDNKFTSDSRVNAWSPHVHDPTTFSTTTTTTTRTTTTNMNKPPIPTSPKPDFSSFRSAQKHNSKPSSSPESPLLDHDLPPTTNHLNSHQRSDLIRKSRKLAQVFGQTPAADSLAKQGQSFLDLPGAGSSSPLSKHRHHRAAHSISSDLDITTGGATINRRENKPGPIWPPPQGTQYFTAGGRRHSTPLTPDQFSFLSEPVTDEYDNHSHHSSELNIEISSTHEGSNFHDDATSFIDLSDSDDRYPSGGANKGKITTTTLVDDSTSPASEDARPISSEKDADSLSAYPTSQHHDQHSSNTSDSKYQRTIDLSRDDLGNGRNSIPDLPPSSPNETSISDLSSLNALDDISICESLSPEAQAEEEKRRRREKLAKVHRFLGSRVPTNLVIGELEDPALPPLAPSDALRMLEGFGNDDDKKWMKRRRSSSAVVLPAWSDDLDRLRDGLSLEEKAINVRRAQKMEKVFGVAPPQTLYHTRHSPSLSATPASGVSTPRTMLRSTSGDTVTPAKNINQSSYTAFSNYKAKKKSDRPGTADSEEKLLPKDKNESFNNDKQRDTNHNAFGSTSGSHRRARGASLVYTHYQHSLNSLNDILDRDDRASLAELHQFLNNPDVHADLIDFTENMERRDPERDYAKDLELFHSGKGKETGSPESKRSSVSSSIRSERRRSLPTPITGTRSSFMSFEPGSPERAYGYSRPYRNRTDSLMSKADSIVSPEGNEFQMRRRKAAKLTQFFGVNYRDLIRDVLDSIEGGLEAERKKGTVSKEEAEDLLQKLRTIKTKRGGLFNS